MSGLAVAFASSLCRAFVNSYTLVKGNTLAQEAFTRELEVVEERGGCERVCQSAQR